VFVNITMLLLLTPEEAEHTLKICQGWKSEAAMIRFTRHARNRMRMYHLTEAEVSDALRQPECVTPTRYGERHAWRHIPRGWLRVTFVKEDQTTIVITVTVRRRGPEES
jgi:Domain of unknown function (DUF4258)